MSNYRATTTTTTTVDSKDWYKVFAKDLNGHFALRTWLWQYGDGLKGGKSIAGGCLSFQKSEDLTYFKLTNKLDDFEYERRAI